MAKSATASSMPGTSRRFWLSLNSHAVSTTKAGFTNSEGWIETTPIWSQRLAPLISGPRNKISAISAHPIRKIRRLARRICFGASVEAANMMATAGSISAACRRTK